MKSLNPIGEEMVLSKTLDFVRFPLIVMVVFIHARFDDVKFCQDIMGGGNYLIYSTLAYAVSENICRIAVPLFFLISGFLFFYKIEEFNSSVYLKKIKRRLLSLLVPYLFWNTLVLLLFCLLQTFVPSLTTGDNKLIFDYELQDWVKAYFLKPISYQLWFLRDLLCITLFAPLIYWIVKKSGKIFLLVMGFLWAFKIIPEIPGLSIAAFFFFSLGAYLTLNKINMVEISRKIKIPLCIIYCIVLAFSVCLRNFEWIEYVKNFNIIAGIGVMFGLSVTYLCNHNYTFDTFFPRCSFFIYLYHSMFIALLIRLMAKSILSNDINAVFIYLSCPIITILFGVVIYKVLSSLMPNFTNFITGSRMKK